MSDDAALIAPNIEALKALAEQCSATDTLPMLTARELLALCALAERVPQLELVAKRQEEMDEERAKAVRQVAAMEGALPFCRRQVEALKGRVEQAEARVAEQTARTHEYIDLHAAAARNNAALKARVASLENLLRGVVAILRSEGFGEWAGRLEREAAPRRARSADGAEGTDG